MKEDPNEAAARTLREIIRKTEEVEDADDEPDEPQQESVPNGH
jgi:hypothetical protein